MVRCLFYVCFVFILSSCLKIVFEYRKSLNMNEILGKVILLNIYNMVLCSDKHPTALKLLIVSLIYFNKTVILSKQKSSMFEQNCERSWRVNDGCRENDILLI